MTIWDRGELVVEDFRENEKILFELSGNKMQAGLRSSRPKSGGRRRTRTDCSLSGNEGISINLKK